MGNLQSTRTGQRRLLLTPGPLTTSAGVRAAMQRDVGSRDAEFMDTLRAVRERVTGLATASGAFTTIPMQGSGTFGLEAVVGSVIPRDGRLHVAINGAYGRRLAEIARRLNIETSVRMYAEDEPVAPAAIEGDLERNPEISHVALCHCETTSGILNPIAEIGAVVAAHGRTYMVDAMSSFGGVPFDLEDCHIDFLVTSSNKCLEGVPGFALVLARLSKLLETEGLARSLSLDLLDQYRTLERTGQFRFTPPTHAILALKQALDELDLEGGVEGRATRYRENHEVLMKGMQRIGFTAYLRAEHQSHIITSFRDPLDPRFHFEEFYKRLAGEGFVIYPGKVGNAACFRVGTIGRIYPDDLFDFVETVQIVLSDMGVSQIGGVRHE